MIRNKSEFSISFGIATILSRCLTGRLSEIVRPHWHRAAFNQGIAILMISLMLALVNPHTMACLPGRLRRALNDCSVP